MGHRFTHKKTVFKNYPSPSPLRLKVPVNMRFAGVSRGYGVQGTCANIGEGERYFSKSSRAHGAPARIHYLCVGDRLINQRDSLSQLRISCSQLRDSCIQLRISCSRRKVVRLFQKWYDFSESPTTFLRISCSHCCISCSHHRISCSRREECASRAQTNHIDQ